MSRADVDGPPSGTSLDEQAEWWRARFVAERAEAAERIAKGEIHPLIERGLLQRLPRPLREKDAKRLQELAGWFTDFVAANEATTPKQKRAARKRADRWRAEFDRRHPSHEEIKRRMRLLAVKLHHDAGRNREAHLTNLAVRRLVPGCRPRSLRRQPRRHCSTPRRARAPGRSRGSRPEPEPARRR